MATPFDEPYAFADIDGVHLHYALDGDPDKPLLALVNPASHNLWFWTPLMPALERHFQVLRFDLRGTGRSRAEAAATYSFSRYAADLAALLEHLELPPAFVMGVAYGARTAARFALEYPGKLAALGLFDVALTPPVDQARQRALAEEARQRLDAAGEPIPTPEKHWRFYEDRETARLAHTAHEQEPDLTGALAAVTVPVLVACGEQDVNLPEAERIAAAMTQAEFVPMPMTGHASPLYRPTLVTTLLIEFAERHTLKR